VVHFGGNGLVVEVGVAARIDKAVLLRCNVQFATRDPRYCPAASLVSTRSSGSYDLTAGDTGALASISGIT